MAIYLYYSKRYKVKKWSTNTGMLFLEKPYGFAKA